MQNDLFVRYGTQAEAEEAFRKMLHLKDEWRAQVRECERRLALFKR